MDLTLLVLSLVILSVSGQGSPNCDNKENCNAEGDGHHLMYIRCGKDGTTCECPEGTGTCPVDEPNATLPIDSSKCKEVCSEDDTCVFFKFKMFTQFSECYLMTTDQCDKESSHDCLPSHGCQSGVANPADCPADPQQFSCKVGADGSGLVHDGDRIHWFCTGENLMDIVDIYDLDSAPGGTVCRTDHECGKFNDTADGFLHYRCELKARAEGEWVEVGAQAGGHDADALSNGNLVEPSCDADPLQLSSDSYPQEGQIIQCTQGQINEQDLTISAPNTCILLCDYYSVLTIFTDWNLDENTQQETGEKVWYYRIFGDPDDTDHNIPITMENGESDVLKCWI